jgi:hypothetical protein
LNWDKETNQVGGYSDCKTCRYCFGVVKRRCSRGRFGFRFRCGCARRVEWDDG